MRLDRRALITCAPVLQWLATLREIDRWRTQSRNAGESVSGSVVVITVTTLGIIVIVVKVWRAQIDRVHYDPDDSCVYLKEGIAGAPDGVLSSLPGTDDHDNSVSFG